MQLVLLCGGLGKRIREIDKLNPKGMIDIHNKPFLDYLLKSLEPHNFSNLHFCFGYKSEKYLSYLKKNHSQLKYTYTVENENELLGTGGAIKNCIDLLDQNFIIQYGDTILKLNYEKFFNLHLQNNKLMTMSILNSSKSEEAPNLYCHKKSQGEISCVYNKKNPPKNANFIDYGALVFDKEIFKMINRRTFDLSDLQEEFTLENKSNFYMVDTKYIEIGTPSSFEKAKLELDDF